MVFPEPDRTSPHAVLDQLHIVDGAAREAILKLPDHDQALSNSIRSSRVVVGQSAFHLRAIATPTPATNLDSRFAVIGQNPRKFIVAYPNLLQNLSALESVAAGRGMCTVLPDPDGIIRRVPVVLKVTGRSEKVVDDGFGS